MQGVERRLRALEATAGQATSNSFHNLVSREHARGRSIPTFIVQPGEDVDAVRAREGIAEGMPCIARVIVIDAKTVEPDTADLHLSRTPKRLSDRR